MLKIVVFFSLNALLFTAEGLQCWNCQNANGETECLENGYLQKCVSSEDVCEIIVRRENGMQTFFKQCKQRNSCRAQMRRNNFFSFGRRQCNEEENVTSHCVCCCEVDRCNRDQELCRKNFITAGRGRQCPRLADVPQVQVSCSNGCNFGSRCDYTCSNDNYTLYPPETSSRVCLPPGVWSNPEPCCALPCPPYLVFDILSIFHVGSEGARFTEDRIGEAVNRKIIYSPNDGYLYGRVPFNKFVDRNKITRYDQFPPMHTERSADGELNGGRALRWAFENTRNEAFGNRPDVPDLVLIVTDSSFDDDVAVPAKMWRDAGIKIYVERQPDDEGNYASFDQMLQITGDPSFIFTLEDRSDEAIDRLLDAEFDHMCQYRCARPVV